MFRKDLKELKRLRERKERRMRRLRNQRMGVLFFQMLIGTWSENVAIWSGKSDFDSTFLIFPFFGLIDSCMLLVLRNGFLPCNSDFTC
jgi:hypothetical protein